MSKNPTNTKTTSLAQAKAAVAAFRALRKVSAPELEAATKTLIKVNVEAEQLTGLARINFLDEKQPVCDDLERLITLFEGKIDPAHKSLEDAVQQGDADKAEKAEKDLTDGYEEAAKLSPKLKKRFEALEADVAALKADVKALQDDVAPLTANDPVQDTRIRRIEDFLAAQFPGQFSPWPVVTSDPAPTKPFPVPPQGSRPTDADSRAAGGGDEAPAPPKKGLIAGIVDGLKLAFPGKKGQGFPRPDQYARPRTTTNNPAVADGGAH